MPWQKFGQLMQHFHTISMPEWFPFNLQVQILCKLDDVLLCVSTWLLVFDLLVKSVVALNPLADLPLESVLDTVSVPI